MSDLHPVVIENKRLVRMECGLHLDPAGEKTAMKGPFGLHFVPRSPSRAVVPAFQKSSGDEDFPFLYRTLPMPARQ